MQARELLITDIAKLEFDIKQIYNLLRRTNLGMSWGINKPSNYKEQVLAFKVQGFLHKGWVYISLDLNDTFTITLTKANRTTITKQIKEVYIEDLVATLDRYIEKDCTDKEYSKKIKQTYNAV